MVKNIIKRSYPATCGISEKEVRVAKKNVDKAIAKLKKAGFYVIGKSLDKGPSVKLWYIRGGSL